MSDRCKIGDMAIIIKDEVGCETNIGRMVTVMGPRVVSPVRGTIWRIKPVVGTTMAYVATDGTVDFGEATDIEHRDDWLLPIRPEAEDRAIEVRVELPFEVEAI